MVKKNQHNHWATYFRLNTTNKELGEDTIPWNEHWHLVDKDIGTAVEDLSIAWQPSLVTRLSHD